MRFTLPSRGNHYECQLCKKTTFPHINDLIKNGLKGTMQIFEFAGGCMMKIIVGNKAEQLRKK